MTPGAWIVFALALLVIVPMLRGFIGGAPFVPTPMPAARRMAELARIRPGDRVLDPGCGDGRLLVACLEAGAASADGYELFLFPYLAARLRALRWRGRMRVHFRDGRRAPYADANLVVCFLLPEPLARMRPSLQAMRPGARVVSYMFAIPGWAHAHRDEPIPAENRGPIYLYEVGR